MRYLLCDFGATNVKTAIVDLDSGRFRLARRFDAAPSRGKGPFCEAPLKKLSRQFGDILDYYSGRGGFEGVFISSQMHGFAVVDGNFRPLTDYISWKDERSLLPVKGRPFFPALERQSGVLFRRETGMRLRPGLPFANLAYLARTGAVRAGRVITLPDWLADISGKSERASHGTMLAGLGLYNIYKKAPSAALLDLCGGKFSLNRAAGPAVPAGHWGKIPIFCAVGDHQCAVLGAGNTEKTLSVNMGTGSQVSHICQARRSAVEQRPFFDGLLLDTITHIPCGRALEKFAGFADGLRGGGDFMRAYFSALTAEKIAASSLEIDLAFFKSAWNYSGGAKITGIGDNLTPENYAASLARCLLVQYVEAARAVDPQGRLKEWILSGGAARKLKPAAAFLAKLTGRKIVPAAPADETFLGLRALAVMRARGLPSALEARNIFWRKT
ncbi:MAG: hypothetical protein WC421_06905 [Elusimicrobiales bacterium]